MAKVDFRTLTPKEHRALEEELWGTLRSLRQKELLEFLHRLFTTSERVMFARRIRIAKCLLKGMPLWSVAAKLKVGIVTVHSVDRWLREEFSEYRKILPPLYEELQEERRRGREPVVPGTFHALCKKYPLAFLLFNMLLDEE